MAAATLVVHALCSSCAASVEEPEVAVAIAAISNGTSSLAPEQGSVWTAYERNGMIIGGCSATMLNNQWLTSAFHCYRVNTGEWTLNTAASDPNWVEVYTPAPGYRWHIRSGGTRDAPTQTRDILQMHRYPGNTTDTNQPGGQFVDIVLFKLASAWSFSNTNQTDDFQMPLWPLTTSALNGRQLTCRGWGGGSNTLLSGTFDGLVQATGDTPDTWNNIYFGDRVWFNPVAPTGGHEGGDSGGGCFVRDSNVDYQVSVHRGVPPLPRPPGITHAGLSTATTNYTAGRPGVRQWIDHVLHKNPPLTVLASAQAPPGVTSQAKFKLDVFWIRNSDGHMIQTRYRPFSLPQNVDLGVPPGVTLAANRIAAESWAPGRLDVFARTTNGELWQRFAQDDTFEPGWFKYQFATTAVTSGPALASWGPNRLDIFARGPNGEVRHGYFDNGWSSTWESLEGSIVGEPAAVSWGPGRIDVFARGINTRLLHKSWEYGVGWKPCFQGCKWEDLGEFSSGPSANLGSAPTVTSWKSGRLDVYARSTGGNLVHRWFEGNWVRDWIDTGIPIPSAPSGVSWGPGRIDLFSSYTSGTLWRTYYPQ